MIQSHIREQIDMRIKWMKPECYKGGSCVMCGCQTTELQMANKACDGDCYPPMMNKKQWEAFKKGKALIVSNQEFWVWSPGRLKPIFHKKFSTNGK